jgi:hypothetical protein
MCLRLLEDDRMALLENLVNGDKSFKRLNFIGKDRLPIIEALAYCTIHISLETNAHFHARPERVRVLVVPSIDDAAADMFPCI